MKTQTAKTYTHLETPGGIVKLPRPMTDAEIMKHTEEHNAKVRAHLAVCQKNPCRCKMSEVLS